MKNLSRKQKLLLCILLLLISLFFIGIITELPSPTLEIAIRRKEKQQLIGPSEIIDQLDYNYYSDGHLILGKTDNGWITYEYIDDLGWDGAELRFFPEEETATIFCTDFCILFDGKVLLPIFVIPQKQDTASAKMTLRVATESETRTHQLESNREKGGYYLFCLPEESQVSDRFWLLQQAITNSCQEYVVTGTVEIQIDFYDHSGSLVDTYTRTVTK